MRNIQKKAHTEAFIKGFYKRFDLIYLHPVLKNFYLWTLGFIT